MRSLDPTLVDNAIGLYVKGKTVHEVAAELPISATTLSRKLRERGVKARDRAIPCPPQVLVDYATGESVLSISERYGVARGVVDRWLDEAGLGRRDSSSAAAIRMGKMSRSERAELTKAANAALRGVPAVESRLEQAARTRQLRPAPMSRHEKAVAGWLSKRNIPYVREQAAGRYNIDFAIPPVAVEVLGGEWHGSRVKSMVHGRRTPYLLDSGWALAFVWATPSHPMGEAVADYLVSYVDEARRDPSIIGEYRVIRGDAKLLARGRREHYERTGIVPSRDR